MIPHAVWLQLLVLSLAVARCARLAAVDTITANVRDGWYEWLVRNSHLTLAEGIVCTWCWGIWFGFAWVTLWYLSQPVAFALALPLAVAHAAGLLNP